MVLALGVALNGLLIQAWPTWTTCTEYDCTGAGFATAFLVFAWVAVDVSLLLGLAVAIGHENRVRAARGGPLPGASLGERLALANLITLLVCALLGLVTLGPFFPLVSPVILVAMLIVTIVAATTFKRRGAGTEPPDPSAG